MNLQNYISLPSLVLDGNALPMRVVVLLGSQFLHKEQMIAFTRRAFAQVHLVCHLPGDPNQCHLCFSHLSSGFINAFYIGLSLKMIWKTNCGSECSIMNRSFLVFVIPITAKIHWFLVGFLMQLKVLIITF